ncbi:hypothetical protein ABW21_db0200685 [Orbilia brochopaga]|nr:hypothetical protein ABW21_db0200685 [Drechslerella brochopaga]
MDMQQTDGRALVIRLICKTELSQKDEDAGACLSGWLACLIVTAEAAAAKLLRFEQLAYGVESGSAYVCSKAATRPAVDGFEGGQGIGCEDPLEKSRRLFPRSSKHPSAEPSSLTRPMRDEH